MSDDDSYEIPLQDQRVFGAGIKRKRVKFVPSSSSITSVHESNKAGVKSASDLYLSLVLPKDLLEVENRQSVKPADRTDNTAMSSVEALDREVCTVCHLPLSSVDDETESRLSTRQTEETPLSRLRPHEASLAHQVCLEHSHPPSHLDRKRKGLAYLSSYGWDPDSRLGLGAEGQGIRIPIKAKPKDDKLGIGVVLPDLSEIPKRVKTEKLDAGKVRKMYEKDKRKGERLRNLFYGNDDVERYLGGG
ncbi:hypothetical protein B0O99DRAFT_627222 [Bisporella sp. PMI_857]|nr:hypothetical protein B0O99DRAFT_627222 [Bisporella sp. PMI_857]